MKNYLTASIAALSISLAFACGNSTQKSDPNNTPKNDSIATAGITFICPCGGCPEVKESKAGNCPKCKMELVEKKK